MSKPQPRSTDGLPAADSQAKSGVDDARIGYQRTMHGPGWGWAMAEQLAKKCESEEGSPFGRRVQEAAEYLRHGPAGGERATGAARRYPDIDTAVRLWKRAELRHQLKLRVLAEYPRSEIAVELGVGEDMVAVLEELFFDVRSSLGASDWVRVHIFQPETKSSGYRQTNQLQTAYWGGRAAVELLAEAEGRLAPERVARLEQQDLLLQARMKEALDVVGLNQETALPFMEQYLKFRTAQDRLALDQQKFQQHCTRELQRHQLAQQRIAVSERCDQERSAEHAAARQAASKSPLAALCWSTATPPRPVKHVPAQQPVPRRRSVVEPVDSVHNSNTSNEVAPPVPKVVPVVEREVASKLKTKKIHETPSEQHVQVRLG